MILYHQTSTRFVSDILKHGLVAREPNAWKGLLDGIVAEGELVVWFTDNIRPLGSYLHSSKCIVQVDSSLLSDAGLRRLKVSGWWVHVGSIPPYSVQLTAWQRYRKCEPAFWRRKLCVQN